MICSFFLTLCPSPGVQELGSLLGVAPAKAEAMASDMIIEGRLVGLIDQVSRSATRSTAVRP